MMSVEEAITGRRSIRAFLPTPVPRATIEAILETARWAPSGSNIQPWKVRVLLGDALVAIKAELAARHAAGDDGAAEYQYYPRRWREPYLGRRRATGWGLYGLLGIGRGDRDRMRAQTGRNFVFFDAPVGLVFTIDRDLELGSWLDYGMFIQSVMLAARGHGLETCSQAALCSYHGVLAERLAVPPAEMIVCAMAVGRPDPAAPANRLRTGRMALSDFVTFHGEA
jgi:nitroreductase